MLLGLGFRVSIRVMMRKSENLHRSISYKPNFVVIRSICTQKLDVQIAMERLHHIIN